MKVVEAVARMSEMPEGSTLVAKPPLTWDAEAQVVVLDSPRFGVTLPGSKRGVYSWSKCEIMWWSRRKLMRIKKCPSHATANFS